MSFKSKKDQRGLINVPANSAAERVLMEKDLGGGSVLRTSVLEEQFTWAGAILKTFTGTIPANSHIQAASIINVSALTFAGNVAKMGLGTNADPDAFALSDGTATIAAKTDLQPVEATAIVAAAVRPTLAGCTTAGAAGAGTNTATGVVKGRLLFSYTTPIAT